MNSSTKLCLATLLGFVVTPMTNLAVADDGDPPKTVVTIVNAESNLLSQEIWGEWELDEGITKYIAEGERTELTRFTIKKDEESSDRMKKAIVDFIDSGEELSHRGMTREVAEAAKTIYCAGKMSGKKDGKLMELDFALASANGTPILILIFNEHLDATFVSFVRDPDGDRDLLFAGGATPTKHFRCYKRATPEKD